MTPTLHTDSRMEKEFELAWILDEGAYKSSTAKQFYEAGYIRARTEQATEIAELKAKLAEVIPLAKFGAMAARMDAKQTYKVVVCPDLTSENLIQIAEGVFCSEGFKPNIGNTIEQLLKD